MAANMAICHIKKNLTALRQYPRVALNNIRDLPEAFKAQHRKGRGRGSGRGKTSGRGHKGQGQRNTKPRLGFEGGQTPLYLRVPKHGFKNIFQTAVIWVDETSELKPPSVLHRQWPSKPQCSHHHVSSLEIRSYWRKNKGWGCIAGRGKDYFDLQPSWFDTLSQNAGCLQVENVPVKGKDLEAMKNAKSNSKAPTAEPAKGKDYFDLQPSWFDTLLGNAGYLEVTNVPVKANDLEAMKNVGSNVKAYTEPAKDHRQCGRHSLLSF
nr:uncharacterized protein LOC131785169 [Pocillopora verrucosa]